MSNQIGAPYPFYGNAFQTPSNSTQASPNPAPNQPGRIAECTVNGNYMPVTGEYGGSNSYPYQSIGQRASQPVPTSQPGNVRVTHTTTVYQQVVETEASPAEIERFFRTSSSQLLTPEFPVHTFAPLPIVSNQQINIPVPIPTPTSTPSNTAPLGQQGQGQGQGQKGKV